MLSLRGLLLLLSVSGAILILLKATGVIDWSWWWALKPHLVMLALFALGTIKAGAESAGRNAGDRRHRGT